MEIEEDPVKKQQIVDARARNISHNVRCLECGSQSIEESQADIAVLLRKVVSEPRLIQMAQREENYTFSRRFADRGSDKSVLYSRARGDRFYRNRRSADRGNEMVNRDPWDIFEIKRLRRRVRDLELEHEIQRLKQRVQDLEASLTWKETGPEEFVRDELTGDEEHPTIDDIFDSPPVYDDYRDEFDEFLRDEYPGAISVNESHDLVANEGGNLAANGGAAATVPTMDKGGHANFWANPYISQLIREEIRSGKSDKDIYKKLEDEYGETILYAPKFDWQTAGLWLSPLLIVGAAGGIWAYGRHRQRTNVHLLTLNLNRGIPLTPKEHEAMLEILTPPPPQGFPLSSPWWTRWLPK